MKEVKFMQMIKHGNCIEYYNCYLREHDHTAWVSYCASGPPTLMNGDFGLEEGEY